MELNDSPSGHRAADRIFSDEDPRTRRRRLAAVWLAVGSAPAAMIASTWYAASRDGRLPLGGDMSNHAGIAEWMRTLDWWDWRGWSDWFAGGKAVGVSYPPLSHLWIRFVGTGHAQMLAVALGLLVLLPWGASRLSRAVGYSPSGQRAAVATALILPGTVHGMYWLFSGFHSWAGFGSWPDMLAAVAGLFCAAWAAQCRRPLACGVVAGLTVLCNLTVVPGVAVVCAALVAGSGADARQILRWTITSASAALAVCAWWLVPFVAGLERLIHYKYSLPGALARGGLWGVAVLAAISVAAALAARLGPRGSRCLAAACAAGLLAALLGDLAGFNHAVGRWLTTPLLVAAVAGAGLADGREYEDHAGPLRPTWTFVGLCLLAVTVVVTAQLWILPIALWLLLWPRRALCWGTAVAWTAVLITVPLFSQLRTPVPRADSPTQLVLERYGHDAAGAVYMDRSFTTGTGAASHSCGFDEYPWSGTVSSDGRVRPLDGRPYLESSPVLEFLAAETFLELGVFSGARPERPHWSAAWESAGRPSLYSHAAAAALGARWYAECDDEHGAMAVSEVPGVDASGATVRVHRGEESWHAAAVQWWIGVSAGAGLGQAAVPALSTEASSEARPLHQAAAGVSLLTEADRLVVVAEQPGWAWLRVGWDPYWRSDTGAPVLKGGPGQMIVWLDSGTSTLRWRVPALVDASAATVTVLSLLGAGVMSALNRRRGFEIDTDRRRPAAAAVETFASTVDAWAHTARAACRGALARTLRRLSDRRSGKR